MWYSSYIRTTLSQHFGFHGYPLHTQVFLASNNQIGSVQVLGKRPKKGAGLRHVDLSNNSISSIEAPRSAYAFRRIKSLKLASNHLICFEEDAALELTSLERLDVSGACVDVAR